MWRYEEKTPVLSQRELELGDQASKGAMHNRFAAVREVLSYDSTNWPLLERVSRCGEPYPCHSKYCHKCFNSPLDADAWRVDPHRFIADDVVNPVYYRPHVGRGTHRHIQRTIRMLEPFYGLPVDEIVPATVKFCILQGGEDYVAVKSFYHRWMREIMDAYRKDVHPGAMLTYRFEWSWTTAGQVNQDLPFRAPGVVDVADIHPDQVVALFHAHTIGHFPGFQYAEGGQFFRMVFDGSWQVHVEPPRLDMLVGPNGQALPSDSTDGPSCPFDLFDANRHQLPDTAQDKEIPIEAWLRDLPHGQYKQSIDDRLDALDPQLGDEIEQERISGLVNYAAYTGKERLPEAESRHRTKARALKSSHASHTSSCNGELITTRDEIDSNTEALTPEQMVIACHADAELKSAFYRKRLMHSIGTKAKAGSTKTVSTPDPEADVSNDHQRSSVKNAVHQVPEPTAPWSGPLSLPRGHSTNQMVAIPLPMDHRTAPQQLHTLWTTWIKIENYYKGTWDTCVEAPLFIWLGPAPTKTLSLGFRDLQPP